MSLRLEPKPLNAFSLRTSNNSGTGTKDARDNLIGVTLLFSLVSLATLTIWITDPFADWIYECCIFILATLAVLRVPRPSSDEEPRRSRTRATVVRCAVAVLALWGFGQLAVDRAISGTTVDRWVTLNASLRIAALAATALATYLWTADRSGKHNLRERFLTSIAWFGFVLAVVSWTAYYTSPQQILWLFPSRYPDVWGPFESRNHFAQFLELILPICLCLGLNRFEPNWLGLSRATSSNRRPSLLARGNSSPLYLTMSAILLAAGAASASRAGVVLLMLETLGVLYLLQRANRGGPHASKAQFPGRRNRVWVGIVATIFLLGLVLASGGRTLIGRLMDPDPLAFRSEIFQSAFDLIRAHPWRGYGIGTFSLVYPEFARFDAGRLVEHAHNDWLEFATGGGLGFALAWLMALAAMVRPALQSVWGIGLLAVCVHALVDDPFSRLGVAAWVFVLAGLLERAALVESTRGDFSGAV